MASVKKENKRVCVNCDKRVVPIIKFRKVTQTIRDTTFNYIELSAHCPICGEEIYMEEVNDANVVSRYNGFIAAKVSVVPARGNGKTQLLTDIYKDLFGKDIWD